jgi:hypothetical protein
MQVGEVLSKLARQSLQSEKTAFTRSGIILMPAKEPGNPVTMERVNQLRDEE